MRRSTAFVLSGLLLVVVISFYLMVESNKSLALDSQKDSARSKTKLNEIDQKIQKIQDELIKNRKFIQRIKEVVASLDKTALQSGLGLDMLRNAINMEISLSPRDLQRHMSMAPSYTFSANNPVAVDKCAAFNTSSDIDMFNLYDKLDYRNVNGGVWKQGFDITYDMQQYSEQHLKVFVVPHSHCDPGWIKTFSTYFNAQTRLILKNMLAKLEQYPKMRFVYAEISFFAHWWDTISDEEKERVLKLIKNGQLEIVTGGWVMPDEANTHYFAIIEQLRLGHHWVWKELGVKPNNGWAIDPFGMSPTLAYVLKRSGLNNMVIQRVHYSIKRHFAQEKSLEFRWRQPWDSGSQSTDILCHMMPFYSYDVPHTCGPDPKLCCQFDFKRLPGGKTKCPWGVPPVPITDENVAQRAAVLVDQYRKKAQLYKNNVVLIPLGDDFRYDTPKEWDNQYSNYQKLFDYMNKQTDWKVEARFGTLSDYFKAVYERSGSKPGSLTRNYPSLVGDFFTYADRDDHYWSGYFTSRPFYKSFDRALEARLRAADISLALAEAYAQRSGPVSFPSDELRSWLLEALKEFSLFQHHDGITGTAKDFVVVDYAKRLLSAFQRMQNVMRVALHFLLLRNKAELPKEAVNKFVFDVDEVRVSHDSLPEKPVIHFSASEPTSVILFNSLGFRRQSIVILTVSSPFVVVKNEQDEIISVQVSPHFLNNEETSNDLYKLAFTVDIAALSAVRYSISQQPATRMKAPVFYAKTTFVRAKQTTESVAVKRGPFIFKYETATEFSLFSQNLDVKFSPCGLMRRVTRSDQAIDMQIDISFVKYGARPGKERSGAYLFLPNGAASEIPCGNPFYRITRGSLYSEITVFLQHVQHTVRLLNSPGVDGQSILIRNIVDIRLMQNFEVAMKIQTGIKNVDSKFYTDLNGLQIAARRYQSRLPLQANFYPAPTCAFLEDEGHRVTLVNGQSLGVASLSQGSLEVIMDRRLSQDDNRGLGQGLLDNKRTPNAFLLLVEKRAQPLPTHSLVPLPTLLSHLSNLHLDHPIFSFPEIRESAKLNPPISSQLSPSFRPIKGELPCGLHLLNFRVHEEVAQATLTLHNVTLDCSIPVAAGPTCSITKPISLKWNDLFNNLTVKSVTETSLTMMHDRNQLKLSDDICVKPMEIETFKIQF